VRDPVGDSDDVNDCVADLSLVSVADCEAVVLAEVESVTSFVQLRDIEACSDALGVVDRERVEDASAVGEPLILAESANEGEAVTELLGVGSSEIDSEVVVELE
jgi:hypothetical protein